MRINKIKLTDSVSIYQKGIMPIHVSDHTDDRQCDLKENLMTLSKFLCLCSKNERVCENLEGKCEKSEREKLSHNTA
jgi:hypothetical protein